MEQENQSDTQLDRPLSYLANCTVDTSYRFTFYQVSYSLIFVLGLATNGLALHRLWLSPRTHTSTAIYLGNLSAADLFFVVSLPLRIYYYHHQAQRPIPAHSAAESTWIPGKVFCQLTFVLKYISLYGGIFFLVCIAVDRYFAVVHPLVSSLRRLCAARLVSVGIWCMVLGLSVGLPLLRTAAGHRHQPCLLDPSSKRQQAFILISLGLVLAAFLLPALLLLFSYCSMLRVLRQPRHRSRSQRHGRQHTLIIIYWVLAIFLLCFAPYHFNLLGYTLTHVGLLDSCGLARVTMALHPVVLVLASSNCCLNPLIYYFSRSLVQREPVSSGGSGSQGDGQTLVAILPQPLTPRSTIHSQTLASLASN